LPLVRADHRGRAGRADQRRQEDGRRDAHPGPLGQEARSPTPICGAATASWAPAPTRSTSRRHWRYSTRGNYRRDTGAKRPTLSLAAPVLRVRNRPGLAPRLRRCRLLLHQPRSQNGHFPYGMGPRGIAVPADRPTPRYPRPPSVNPRSPERPRTETPGPGNTHRPCRTRPDMHRVHARHRDTSATSIPA
jgi:hypothetical protein